MRSWILVLLIACGASTSDEAAGPEVVSGDEGETREAQAEADEPTQEHHARDPARTEPVLMEPVQPEPEPAGDEIDLNVLNPPTPVTTPEDVARCAAQAPSMTDCIWEIGLRPTCQGIRVAPGRPIPGPSPVCVCHQCTTDSDCTAEPEGACLERASSCSNATTRVCAYGGDLCPTCPGRCEMRTNPDTGEREPLCERLPPPA